MDASEGEKKISLRDPFQTVYLPEHIFLLLLIIPNCSQQ